MSVEEMIADIRNCALELATNNFDACLAVGESPIEKLAIAGLLANSWKDTLDDENLNSHLPFGALGMSPALVLKHRDCGTIGLQVECELDGKQVRFDAVCIMVDACRETQIFVVEFDGHDFHERTKAQSARDKSRDRAITRRKWVPLRFTGGEVYAVSECLHEHLDDVFSDSVEEGSRRCTARRAARGSKA